MAGWRSTQGLGGVDRARGGAGQHRAVSQTHGRRTRPRFTGESVLDEGDSSINECLVDGHEPTVGGPGYAL